MHRVLHCIINAICWSKVHYAADQYSIGYLACWRSKLLTFHVILLSDRETLDLMDLLVEMVPLESR